MNILRLMPKELLIEIIKLLDIRSQHQLSLVSMWVRTSMDSDNLLWFRMKNIYTKSPRFVTANSDSPIKETPHREDNPGMRRPDVLMVFLESPKSDLEILELVISSMELAHKDRQSGNLYIAEVGSIYMIIANKSQTLADRYMKISGYSMDLFNDT